MIPQNTGADPGNNRAVAQSHFEGSLEGEGGLRMGDGAVQRLQTLLPRSIPTEGETRVLRDAIYACVPKQPAKWHGFDMKVAPTGPNWIMFSKTSQFLLLCLLHIV